MILLTMQTPGSQPRRTLDSKDVTEDRAICQKFILDIFKEALPRARKHIPAERAEDKELYAGESTPIYNDVMVSLLGYLLGHFVISV